MTTRLELERKILNEYAHLRAEHEKEAVINLERARQNKDFNDVYLKIKDLEFEIAQKNFKNESTEELTSSLSRLKSKLRQIIKKNGLDELSFVPNFTCKLCKDTGFIGREQCQCFRTKVNQELIKACGLEISKLNTFNDYNHLVTPDSAHQQVLSKIKDQLVTYSQKFPNVKPCVIILSGPTGVGKTFALECTTSEILKNGHTANFITAFQLNNQFVKYHGCYDANKQSYLNILLDPDLLVIDDLGTEPMLKNVTKEYLYLVISERMLKHKGTLISTNLTPANIMERYGERIFSRLFDKQKSLQLKIEGNDLRRLKRS